MESVEFAWTSGGGATVSSTIRVDGRCWAFRLTPVTGKAPADGYSVTLLDSDGLDVLHGAGVAVILGTLQLAFEKGEMGAANSVLTLTFANYGAGDRRANAILWYA